MKDPNDFMLAQSEGEQVKRLTAELAAAHRAHLAELNGQETRIRSLEAGIELYKVELAVANEGWLAADKLKLDAQNQLSAELALRQTAEAYAARNALRVIEVEAVADQRIDKIAVLAAALTKVHGIIAEYWGPCMGSIESLATIRDAIGPDAAKWGPKLPQTEPACTCDSTLVTDTSNHQPHCPRYVAETKP